MRPHVARLCKGLVTIRVWADIGFTAGVIVEMSFQVVFLGEGFRADWTVEGFYTYCKRRCKMIHIYRLLGCTLTYLNAIDDEASYYCDLQRIFHKLNIGRVFHHYAFAYVASGAFCERNAYHIQNICAV